MASLKEIRCQLHSVENIKKITQALEMVAASRLRQAQAKAESARPYASVLTNIMTNLVSAFTELSHPLMIPRTVKRRAIVVVAGDKGLCGGYNNAIFSATERELKDADPKNVELVLVGRKAVDYFSRRKWKIHDTLVDWGGKITYEGIENFTNKLIDSYLSKEFDEIILVYTRYVSLSAREIKVEKFLNLHPGKSQNRVDSENYIFEPDGAYIFSRIVPRYCLMLIQQVFNEAYAAELSARIFAMHAATKNAGDMIESLTLTRNKIRQSSITRELIEISSCVESLK